MVVEPNKDPPLEVVAAPPNIELVEAELADVFPKRPDCCWAVSPDGAKMLVLLLGCCSALVPALRLANSDPPVDAGVEDDWPNSDILRKLPAV